jgi:hypothetical protein
MAACLHLYSLLAVGFPICAVCISCACRRYLGHGLAEAIPGETNSLPCSCMWGASGAIMRSALTQGGVWFLGIPDHIMQSSSNPRQGIRNREAIFLSMCWGGEKRKTTSVHRRPSYAHVVFPGQYFHFFQIQVTVTHPSTTQTSKSTARFHFS